MNLLTAAVSAVVTDDVGRVLLCQQSQGHRRWGLPGGRIRRAESPVDAVVRDIREETGMEIDIVDLVGIYQLTGDGRAAGTPVPPPRTGTHQPLPDVLVHVFRGRARIPEATVNAPGRICRLGWHDSQELPEPMTPITRTAIRDAVAGRSGVLREVWRDAEPELPDAVDLAGPSGGPDGPAGRTAVLAPG